MRAGSNIVKRFYSYLDLTVILFPVAPLIHKKMTHDILAAKSYVIVYLIQH
jgi:hypothetical protein